MKPEILEGLMEYRDHQRPPGDFLRAVLANNLREAACKADSENAKDLAEITAWCVWNLPGECWGSPAKVGNWLHPSRPKYFAT